MQTFHKFQDKDPYIFEIRMQGFEHIRHLPRILVDSQEDFQNIVANMNTQPVDWFLYIDCLDRKAKVDMDLRTVVLRL